MCKLWCRMCGVARADRADWDDYAGLCPACSYNEHLIADGAEFREAAADAMAVISEMLADVEQARVGLRREIVALLAATADAEDADPARLRLARAAVAAAKAAITVKIPAALLLHEAGRVAKASRAFA